MADSRENVPSRNGQIVTFYSFKGGTGRTMALANVAWILAANGKQVLVADWDLESPGLHRFFHPFLNGGIRDEEGIIDLIRAYEWDAMQVAPTLESVGGDDEWVKDAAQRRLARLAEERARVQPYAFSLNWEFGNGGSLAYLSAGQQNSDYVATLSALAWDIFYDRLHGAQFFAALRLDMKRHYDYVLIDSRTGLSDVANICTVDLPDVLVDCFTLSTQGIEGAAEIARIVTRSTKRDIRILPVPMRIDQAEKEKADAGQALAMRLLDGLPAGLTDAARYEYWRAVEVPYQPFYAYEETLAVFGDSPGSPGSLLSAFERITAQITSGAVSSLPPMDELRRLRTRARFTRQAPPHVTKIVIDFVPVDQLWAEWIASVLAGAGIAVGDLQAGPVSSPAADGEGLSRVLAVVTQAYANRIRIVPLGDQPDLAVYVDDTDPQAQLSAVPVAVLAGMPEHDATDRLIGLVGGRPSPLDRTPSIRYPGGGPRISKMPDRNALFTGREDDIVQLREQLRASGMAILLPLALHGLGGVGKTQLAIEYVHRFRADYDIVWWMTCGQPQYIDASLADLGAQMRAIFHASIPDSGTVTEIAREVLQVLSQSRLVRRWLLVYDNAEDIGQVKPLLPSRGGHILITSRNGNWSTDARPLEVDVFDRQESISHLLRRAPGITASSAEQLAAALGDLPAAVAAAGALLANTGTTVSDYLEAMERQPTSTLELKLLPDYPEPVAKTWGLSLDRLQETDPAAARLMELCSVMAPDISLDLLFSRAMADVLKRLDPQLAEPIVIGRVVEQVNKLALIKLDAKAHQIQIHRLMQAVVRDRMSAKSDDEIASARRDVHQVLVGARPSGSVDDPKAWPLWRVIWFHLTPSEAVLSEEEPVRQLLIDRVRYLRQRGDLERGDRRAREIQLAWEAMLDAEPEKATAHSLRIQLLQLRFNLANIVRDLARFDESRELDTAVLRDQGELLGTKHPHYLMTAGSLAADFRALGQYGKALELDLTTFEAWRDYGVDAPGTLTAAHNLAVSLRLTGDVEGALAHDRDTLDRRTAVLGAGHPRTLDSHAAVARDLLEVGSYGEVVTEIETVWAACRRELGDGDRATLNARALLGVALRSAGRREEAEEHISTAMNGLIRGFGSASSDALACRLSHAANLLAFDRASEAHQEAQAVLTVYEERLGPNHPHSLGCRVNIATGLYLQENYDAALGAAQAAAAGMDGALGPDHPYTLAASMVLAGVLAARGSLDEAAELEERTAAALERVLGSQHPDTLRCRANLLLTQHEQGVGAAAAERQEVIGRLSALLGAEHPDIASLAAGRRSLRVIDPQPF